MSAPAQNPRPAPVRTMPTTRSSRSAAAIACFISAIMLPVIAFNCSGRFRVIVAIGSSTSYLMSSYSVIRFGLQPLFRVSGQD